MLVSINKYERGSLLHQMQKRRKDATNASRVFHSARAETREANFAISVSVFLSKDLRQWIIIRSAVGDGRPIRLT